MNFFLPKQSIFFVLFKDLNNHLKEISELFVKFVASFENFEEYAQRAREIEHRADEKTHEIIEKINKTFITPFDREDICLLAHKLDDIIDLIENVIHNICLYQINKKENALDYFAKLIFEASNNLDKLINSLEKLKNDLEFKNLLIKIHTLEDQGDLVFQKAITQLFEQEKNPVLIIKWKDILETLERTMDKYQEVSNVIEGINVKSN